MNIKYYIVLMVSLFIVGCANTKITENWVDENHHKPYKRPMIIGVSDSQQTRQMFEKHFVAELKKISVTAIPSYQLINSKQKMNRETVIAAIEGKDIDAVIVTYLISSETKVKHHESPLSHNYIGDIEDGKISETLVATRGRSSNSEIVTLKNDVYDAASRSLVWTVQTRTVAPESIDEVVTDVVELLTSQMLSDNVIK
ncbi:hypothetical protein MNBD_GAMMA06-1199 [hydrothermal vent metagenome]|uniref:Lipoprotein n=1 Tax=hydrothermal vent metagenome TaxID=652676 RepID=A0A3B0WLT4_9ZZZZ